MKIWSILPVLLASNAAVAQPPELVRTEFIDSTGIVPSVHASTLAETRDGLVAAWFGGTQEGHRDVVVWFSRHVDGRWSTPVEVANGVQPDGTRYPCYNPVLFVHSDTLLFLFYKVGPEPQRWWGMMKTSRDNGQSWSLATRLPDEVLGPIKNKPIRLADGAILSGSSTESHEANSKWRVHFELSRDEGRTWTVVRPPQSEPAIDAIQPSILVHSPTVLQALGRSRQGYVFETWSRDAGRSWGLVTLTALPNPNAGTDALTLRDGRHLLVHNATPRGRTPLNVSISPDGRAWKPVLTLESEPGEYSYPAVIQARDGLVHISYTWRRTRIRHVVLDPTRLP